MRPMFKSAALAGIAVLLIGVSAASSASSSTRSAARSTGSSAASAGPTAVTYKLGQRADSFQFGALWQLDVEPGLYNVDLRATLLLQPDDPNATAASVICGVIDLNTLDGNVPRIYFAQTVTVVEGGLPAALSGSSIVRVTPDMTPGVVCVIGSGSFQLFQPVTATFMTVGKRTYGDSTEVPINGKGLQHQLRHLFKAHALAG
jgi:hypothetical protein